MPQSVPAIYFVVETEPVSSMGKNISQGFEEELTFDEEEISIWVAFDQLGAGFGVRRVSILVELFGSLKAAWNASSSELLSMKGIPRDAIEEFLAKRSGLVPEQLADKLTASNVVAIPHHHPSYPSRLRQIHDPPLVLYQRGALAAEDLRTAISIVGTRNPSAYGRQLAKEFGRQLSACGVTIVSGMAIGVDSLAHWGSLESQGRTVAVLGCGADVCYPSSNKPLYAEIVNKSRGAVVSEFFPGTQPEPWRFPARNRIISGMSHAVIVIEAGESSGALITARIAFEQNRAVFAVPGRVDSRMSVGTNKIIASQLAQLVSSPLDVLSHLQWVTSPGAGAVVPTVVELFGREKEVYDLLSAEPMHFDHLCAKTGMPAGEMSATLTMLELAGVVLRHPGDWYTKEPQSFIPSVS